MKGRKQGALFLAAVLCMTSFSAAAAAEQKTDIKNESKTEIETETNDKTNAEPKKEAKSALKDKADKEKKSGLKTEGNKKSNGESKKKLGSDSKKTEEEEKEIKEEKNEEKEQISLKTIEDFQKIGTEGYPLDGNYVLENDIDGKITETGENTVIEPLITGGNIFTGTIQGNEHAIANFTVQRADEGEQNTAIFGEFSGNLENIKFINMTVISAQNSGAVLAENFVEAKVKNVFLSGTVVLNQLEQFAEKQRIEGCISLFIDGMTWKEKQGLNENQESIDGTSFENVKVITTCSDLSENIPKGISKVATNPDYISGIEGKAESIQAPELEGFTFLGWTAKNIKNAEADVSDMVQSLKKLKTKVSGKEGKYELKASYEYTLAVSQDKETKNNTAEAAITVPCVFGKDITTVEKLEPVDSVFPKQISVVMKLVAIDGVFPSYLSVGKKTEGETIKITTWEQFKNIGNTKYDETFVMNGNYILEANIYSDGKTFEPIGTEENPFTGSFDGNGFEINVSSNPEIQTDAPYNGLFGVVKSKE